MAVITPKSQPRASVAGDTFITRLPKKALGAALGAVVAGLVLAAGQAKAIVVTVVSCCGVSPSLVGDWEVTTFYGSFNDNVSKFATAANGGVMPWFGSLNDASGFNSAVYTSLGAPNLIGGYFYTSPFFGYRSPPGSTDSQFSFGYSREISVVAICGQLSCKPPSTATFAINNDTPWTWAQATLVSGGGSTSGGGYTGGTASVPAPLPILGLAAAFCFSRKLRQRIKLHKGTSAVSTSTGS